MFTVVEWCLVVSVGERDATEKTLRRRRVPAAATANRKRLQIYCWP